MSSQPHTVLPWVVRRTRLPLLSLRCMDCGSESATTGEGKFRVNANGKLLDVWLLVRCVSCHRTSKLTVHERAPVRSFDPAELHGYRANDLELVASRLLDPLLARRNRFTLDWKGALAAGHPVSMARRGVAGPGGGPVRGSGTGAPGTAHRARARPQQERGTAPDQVRHSAAPPDERRIHFYRDGRGLAGM